MGRDTSLKLTRAPLRISMMDSAGDCVDKLCWGTLMDSAGDWKNFAEGDLPWQLAEDNPVISPCQE